MTAPRSMIFVCISLFLLLSLPPAYGAETPTGFLFTSIEVGGKVYKYTVYVPPGYDPEKKWPVIVFLHGAGECGTDGAKQVAQGIGTAILWNVQKWPFIVLFPQKPEVRFPWGQYDEVVMAMLERAKKDYNVDASRLYLTGLSQGGNGTWDIGAKHPDVWAAIAPICGYGEPARYAEALKSMPIWCFHGDADTAVPVKQSQDMVEAIKAAGGSPKLTVYPGVGHNSWDRAYLEERLYDWFLEHAR